MRVHGDSTELGEVRAVCEMVDVPDDEQPCSVGSIEAHAEVELYDRATGIVTGICAIP